MRLTILLPARDDWGPLSRLLGELGKELSREDMILSCLVVDDASRIPCHHALANSAFTGFHSVESIRLHRNLSHQRAIAVGLMYLYTKTEEDAVMIMDADGEDTPEGAVALLREFVRNQCEIVIFAGRSRRTESVKFRFFYFVYKSVHRILIGQPVRVGNFSLLPRSAIAALSVMPELWNHFAAAVFRSGERYTDISIARGFRYEGRSRMNFVSLIIHGLSALSVFGDVIGARFLMATSFMSLASLAAIGTIIGIRDFTDLAVPGSAIYTVGLILILMGQGLSLAVSFTLSILASRSNLSFLPSRDYSYFVQGVYKIYPNA